MLASKHGYLEVAEELLSKNANPNIKRQDGLTALMIAAKYDEMDLVETLLTKGAEKEIKSAQGTAATIAIEKGHLDIANYIKGFSNEQREEPSEKPRHSF